MTSKAACARASCSPEDHELESVRYHPGGCHTRADHRLLLLGLILWISSHFLYLVVVLVLIIALIAWRWRIRKNERKLSTLVLDEPSDLARSVMSYWVPVRPQQS